jgi:hypothetical protein
MLDLAVAANFVRELTEEQFAEPRRRRRTAAPGRTGDGAARVTRASARGDTPAARPHDRAGGRGVRFGATRVARTLSRLVQVRG